MSKTFDTRANCVFCGGGGAAPLSGKPVCPGCRARYADALGEVLRRIRGKNLDPPPLVDRPPASATLRWEAQTGNHGLMRKDLTGLTAWWLHDNHTFVRLGGAGWVKKAMREWCRAPGGTFFVRDDRSDQEVASCASRSRGVETRRAFEERLRACISQLPGQNTAAETEQ